MKLKKYLTVTLAGVIAASIVGCSNNSDDGFTEWSYEDRKADSSISQEDTVTESQFESVTLIDDERLKVDITGMENGMLGAEIQLEIENKMSQDIMVQSRDMSVDGYMQNPIFSVDIMAGKKAKTEMIFSDITDASDLINIEGKLVLIDAASWNDIGLYNVTIN